MYNIYSYIESKIFRVSRMTTPKLNIPVFEREPFVNIETGPYRNPLYIFKKPKPESVSILC